MKIVVMCGGLSPERNVSISSSSLICKALRKMGHQAVLVDMFYGLENFSCEPAELFEKLPPIPEAAVGNTAPDMEKVIAARKWKSDSKIGKGVLEICQAADLVFIGMHGACGEDGRIQATLDLLGIPYTGSGYLGSGLAMDKDLAKRVARSYGVRTPEWKTVSYDEEGIETLADATKLPCVVKPVDSGSSIGVFIANTREELVSALRENLVYNRVILEQYVKGMELDVGVLNDESLPAILIEPKEGFYNYENKYKAGATVETCPAPIKPEIEQKLREAAITVHRALGLSTYSRSDYIVDENEDVYFIEMNTLPGMTPTSLLPQEAAAVGIDYETLCAMIVEGALKETK
ncbi:MAG: D-alanine--D-alanine ligase [Clostridia bacterium]|nr:D-alanine--D-alanine ligase [Clostridia bacterium]